MPRQFEIPDGYRSSLVGSIKRRRSDEDKRKIDLSPSVIDSGTVVFKLARFFGFCYGVENAIETAYRAVRENPGKRIFLVSEMIHNPQVNADLEARGVRFLHTTEGDEIFPLEELTSDDVVIIPAFGSTVDILDRLMKIGVDPLKYDGTCPFVEKVWKRGAQLGAAGFTIVVHGKFTHEETRATLSRLVQAGPALVVLDRAEALSLCQFITGARPLTEFEAVFGGKISQGFDPSRDLQRVGVVNQTTMLAEETREIGGMIRTALTERYGQENIDKYFPDTRDTLCYATSENQRAMRSLVEDGGDVALVVGGYKSSNTSHLAEIASERVPTFYIRDADEIVNSDIIRHYDIHSRTVRESQGWLPRKDGPVTVLLSAGASCPDTLVEAVMDRVRRVVSEGKSAAVAGI